MRKNGCSATRGIRNESNSYRFSIMDNLGILVDHLRIAGNVSDLGK